MENAQRGNAPNTEITREELAHVAYMCYVLNTTWTTRWVRRWSAALERMAGRGWTWEGLHYRGLIRNKLEQVYGLNPRESRDAVAAYPLINMGLQPWQVLTDAAANELTERVYRSFAGLPTEKRPGYWTVPAHGNEGDTSCEGCNGSYNTPPSDVPPSYMDGSEMGGLFYEQ